MCVDSAGSLFYLSTVICHFIIRDHYVHKYDLLNVLKFYVCFKFSSHCNNTSCWSLKLSKKEEIT